MITTTTREEKDHGCVRKEKGEHEHPTGGTKAIGDWGFKTKDGSVSHMRGVTLEEGGR